MNGKRMNAMKGMFYSLITLMGKIANSFAFRSRCWCWN